MRVLDVEDEANVGDRLRLVAATDVMKDEDVDRRKVGNTGSGHAAHDPAAERMIEHDQPELDL